MLRVLRWPRRPEVKHRRPAYLDQSRIGQSRRWSPRCPCVSSRPPPGRSGPRPRCLPSAAPVGAGGASARAPETPAGTGSSCPPLQVSGRGERDGEMLNYNIGRRRKMEACTVREVSIINSVSMQRCYGGGETTCNIFIKKKEFS